MLTAVLRKMKKNKWIVLCLLLGLILTTAIMSSIPMYSSAVIKRVLTQDMVSFWKSQSLYPGGYEISKSFMFQPQIDNRPQIREQQKQSIFNDIRSLEPDKYASELKLPILSKKCTVTSGQYRVTNKESLSYLSIPILQIKSISDLDKHIKIVQGKLFSNKLSEDGSYEVIVSQKAFDELHMELNKPYNLEYWNEGLRDSEKAFTSNPVRVKIVGIYTFKDANDTFWGDGDWGNRASLLMDFGLFSNEYVKAENITNVITSAQWYYAFDYKSISADNFEGLLKTVNDQRAEMNKNGGLGNILMAANVFEKYVGRQNETKTILWVIETPILVLLIIYMFMMSGMIVEEDRNEISLMKSRGASIFQLLQIYLIEGSILGGISIILGPPLGMLLCKIIGASNGFLQFVQRDPLRVSLNFSAYGYSLIAILIFMITLLAAAFGASRESIVVRKQRKSRVGKQPVWKRFYLDVVLLVLTGYGLNSYNIRSGLSSVTGKMGSNLPVDPILYLISVFFILGVGLLFLRIYPYIIRFIFWTGNKKWSAEAYTTLINAARAEGKNQFVMLFLVLTVSIGIFNVKAAGTINQNLEDNIKYSVGADVVLVPRYSQEDASANKPAEDQFATYSSLKGVDMATRVFKTDSAQIKFGNMGFTGLFLMGIVPQEFGRIANVRGDLLSYPFNEYLNVMAENPKAMILSRSFAKQYKLKVGDSIYISKGSGESLDGYIAAFVDYWPSYDLTSSTTFLVVANKDYLAKKMPVSNYEVWIKRQPGTSIKEMYDDISAKKLDLKDLGDVEQSMIIRKNDPVVQGMNGTLTLGFITAMTITIIGFLIHWILSIKSRTLQFGILRSMGINLKKIIKILVYEQLLISGVAVGVGMLIGEVNGRIFVPLIKMASSGSQMVPFKVAALKGQYLNLFIILGLMFILVFFVLARYVSRIKMDQAIKLGED